MGTSTNDNGTVAVVCDLCGHGVDTLARTPQDAIWLAGKAGWSIDVPLGPELCPPCAERRGEAVA